MKPTSRSRGSFLLETAMFMPILLLLMMGMIELARITYTYYQVKKVLYSVARYVGSQQGINFCDDTDITVQQAKNLALTGTGDGSTESLISGLTVDQIQVRIERYTAVSGDIGQCTCAAEGCDISAGGQAPDYVVVSIPNGYSLTLMIPGLPIDPILFRPQVRLPYLGT